ncbi:hypothetical protein COLO4_03886 [Corchorus olitorius]|uniref:Legume lectin domain-containing protein n=1 Tax=Corchorus olitorius TaxID=93759 RepID=A0A1R3KWD4_9ROSI|nr:hypothetical protein COLO4_03886 [Corchorus olitorius]
MSICCLIFIQSFPSSLNALQFNLTDFSSDSSYSKLKTIGDADFVHKKLCLTQSHVDGNINDSVGRVIYANEFQLWDSVQGQAADFVTHFSFNISTINNNKDGGDGFAFFIAPNGTNIPGKYSYGGCMGLINNCSYSNASEIVVVEFDTHKDEWDDSDTHLGININLSEVLPEKVNVGFSSATGNLTEMHFILSWDFNSTDFSSNHNNRRKK